MSRFPPAPSATRRGGAGRGSGEAFDIADTDLILVGRDAFEVNASLDGKRIALGFRMVAALDADRRFLAVATEDAMLTTDARTDQMVLALPAGSDRLRRAAAPSPCRARP